MCRTLNHLNENFIFETVHLWLAVHLLHFQYEMNGSIEAVFMSWCVTNIVKIFNLFKLQWFSPSKWFFLLVFLVCHSFDFIHLELNKFIEKSLMESDYIEMHKSLMISLLDILIKSMIRRPTGQPEHIGRWKVSKMSFANCQHQRSRSISVKTFNRIILAKWKLGLNM